MTKQEFKNEVLADLQYQLKHKGRPFTSEHWYMSGRLYSLKPQLKQDAINELISEGVIDRVSASFIFKGSSDFPILLLNH
jgi:hypothetical protein